MAHGPKSKKRRAFAVRNAVRLAQRAGFDSLDDVLDHFRTPEHSKFYQVDGDVHEPQGIKAFMAAAAVRLGFYFKAPGGIRVAPQSQTILY